MTTKIISIIVIVAFTFFTVGCHTIEIEQFNKNNELPTDIVSVKTISGNEIQYVSKMYDSLKIRDNYLNQYYKSIVVDSVSVDSIQTIGVQKTDVETTLKVGVFVFLFIPATLFYIWAVKIQKPHD